MEGKPKFRILGGCQRLKRLVNMYGYFSHLVVVVVVVVGTGHFCLLQVLVSNGEPAHLLPPFLAICATLRLLVWVPVLQEAVHGDQPPKFVH